MRDNIGKRVYKIKMTRVFLVFFFIMLIVSLLISARAFAEPLALTLDDALVTDNSPTASGNITNFSNNKVEDNVTFHKINDDITYKFVVKNNQGKEMTIVSIDDDNDNNYVSYEYDKHENEKLSAGSSFDFIVKAKYNNSVTDMSQRNQRTSTNFTITYLTDDDSSIINPSTGDSIMISFVLFVVSGVGLITCIVLDKKDSSKKIPKITLVAITGLLLTPIVIKAATLNYKIELVTDYGLFDKQVVTYIINGEEKTLISQYGEAITGLETPNKDGYTFDKWVYEDGSDFDPTQELTSDIKLTAVMNLINYSIIYNLAGGSTSTNNPDNYTVEDNITLVEPTKEHYTFTGWTGTDLDTPTKNVVINSKIGDRSYTANYEPTNYTITYNGLTNEEKASLNNPTTYNIESTSVTLTNPQNRNDSDGDLAETFTGWKEGDTTSATVTLPDLNSLGNKTFEAVWTEASPTVYIITYNLNDGNVATSNPTEFTKKTETFTLVNPTKTGYDFKGWSGTDLTGDENTVVSVLKGTRKNLSFEAHYDPINYQIKFEKNSTNVTGTMPNQVFEYDLDSNLNEVSYTKEGYDFNGWNTKADGTGTNYADKALIHNLTTTKNEVISLFAKWTPKNVNYTVVHKKMDLNGTTYTEADTDHLTGKADSEVTPAVKEYYGFTSPSAKTVTISPNGSTVVEYLYTRNKFTLTINDSQYVEVDKSGQYFYEDTVSLTAKDREDYLFTGWTNGDTNKTINVAITGNITIAPVYEINIYMITLNPSDGTVNPTEIKVTKGGAVGSLPIPEKQFNDFDGWYTTSSFSTKVTSQTVPTEDTTYFAKWIPFETDGLLCKKATTLHSMECPASAACNTAGYSVSGSKGTNIVTFGSIPHVTLVAGNAYDCDVNSDGIYDADNERFYYLTTKGSNAVLISHSNYEGEDGQITVNNFLFSEAVTKLPMKTTDQWKNVRVTFTNPVDSTDTNIYAARFMTYDELKAATGKTSLMTKGDLDDFPYILENTQFFGIARSGIWLSDINGTQYLRIHAGPNNRNVATVTDSSRNVARPVIEVPLDLMEVPGTDSTIYTVSFVTDGGTSVPSFDVEDGDILGTLPNTTKDNFEFVGWYYEPTFDTKANATDIITGDTVLYAKWNVNAVASINDNYYGTLEAAINAVDADEQEVLIKLLKDTSSKITIANKKNIVLDLQNHILSNSSSDPIIENNGYLVIKNGTVNTDSTAASALNNNSNGTIKILDVTINATGAKQAFYNNGGNAEISGDSHLNSSSTDRAVVHNLNNGVLTIKSGEIISTGYYGVYNESGTITIGTSDGTINITNPVIQGVNAGLSIAENKTFNFYDGIIKGVSNAIDRPSSLDGKEDGSEILDGTEDISGTTYKTAIMFMDSSKFKITFDADGGTVSPSYIVINNGDSVGELPTPSKGVYTFDGWYTETSGGEAVNSSYVPTGSITIHARYHFTANEDIVQFNMMSDAMNTYYSNLSTWLGNEPSFETNMITNFYSYDCSECTGPNYQACPTPLENKVLCEQSKGYSVGIDNVNVYESNETTKEKGVLVTYTTVKDGLIYNMIPGHTYYWEATDDSNVHGYVKVSGNRRTIASNVRNVRDIGGLEVDTDGDGTSDGTIKYGRIFRGAKLSSSTSDVTELQKLGITKEVDLRGSSGEAKFPNYAGRAITNYLIYPDTYSQNYATFRQALVNTMNDVINGENIYFHCAIGTDRTGTMAYFLEGLLGVSEEDRVEDYELSFFTGLLNRHRFHDNLTGSSINPRFATMHNTYKTSQSIYEYFMEGSTNVDADNTLINNFRTAMINYN